MRGKRGPLLLTQKSQLVDRIPQRGAGIIDRVQETEKFFTQLVLAVLHGVPDERYRILSCQLCLLHATARISHTRPVRSLHRSCSSEVMLLNAPLGPAYCAVK